MKAKGSEDSKSGRSIYVLEYSSTLGRWLLWTLGGVLVDAMILRPTKAAAIASAADKLTTFAMLGEKSELRVRSKTTGRFEATARTFPRSSDPRRSKG